jgi:Holliday junction DNA helicase RuvB
MADGRISWEMAREALAKLEAHPLGLDQIDHRPLGSAIGQFSGGPVGLDTLAASRGEDADTIADRDKPYLLQRGFLDRTPRGRLATRLAYEHLGRASEGKGKGQGESPQGRLR